MSSINECNYVVKCPFKWDENVNELLANLKTNSYSFNFFLNKRNEIILHLLKNVQPVAHQSYYYVYIHFILHF